MSNFDEVIDKCKKQMQDQNIDIDEGLLTAVAKSLGPSIYNADSLVVATGDEGEMETVRNWAAKKLGVEGGAFDVAAAAATEKIGKSSTKKLRPVYYYLLATETGNESKFS